MFWLAALLFGISAWALSFRMYAVHELGDEGYFVNAAMRILDGEIIYRDFQHNYPPGRMYALALLIKVFGQDLFVVRAFWIACHCAAVAVGFCVARRMMALPLALCVAVAIMVSSVPQNKAVELLVSALVLLVLCRSWEGKLGDFAVGVCLGCLTYFRHDVGVMGCMVFCMQIVIRAYLDPREVRFSARLRARGTQAWRFVAAYVMVGSVFIIFLLYHGSLLLAFEDLALSGLQANVELSYPFPVLVEVWSWVGVWEGVTSNRVAFYAPPVVYFCCALFGLWSLLRSDEKVYGGQLLSAAIFGLLVYIQVIPRTDSGHLSKAYMAAHVLSFALISIVLTAAFKKARNQRWGGAALLLLLAIPVVAIPIKQGIYQSIRRASPVEVLQTQLAGGLRTYQPVEFPFGRLDYRSKRDRTQSQAIVDEIAKYAHLRESETLVAFPAGALFNFVYGYRTPLRYDVLRPGELDNNDPDVLRKLMRNLREARPRVLIYVLEGTNRPLSRLIIRWAENHDYRFFSGPHYRAWIRQD
jgi:hypothetical protein